MPAKQSDHTPVKPRKAWIVYNPKGDPLSVGPCVESAIKRSPVLNWAEAVKLGYRVVRVVITEDV